MEIMSWKDTIQEDNLSETSSWKDTISDEKNMSWKDSIQDENKMGVGEAALTGLGEGATLGFGDELAGLVGATIDRPVSYLMDRLQGVPSDMAGEPEDSTFGQRYKQTRDFARRQQEKAKEDQAGAYYGGMIGGGLATGVATGAIGPAGITGRAALEGAAVGLGGSEADLTEGEYGQAVVDTALGGAAGAIMPQAGKIAGGIYKKSGEAIGGALSKIGKGTKSFGKVVTGVSGDVNEKVIEGASEILGVPKNQLNLEVSEYLRSKGLGFANKEKLLERIGNDLKNVTSPEDIKKIKDVISLVNNSKIGLFDELVRSSKAKSIEDLQSTILGGAVLGSPGSTFAAKKTRDLASSRLKLQAPKVEKIGQKITSNVSDVFEKTGQKAQKFGKEASDFYSNLIKEPGARIPIIQSNLESNLEQVNQSQFYSNIQEKVSRTKYNNVFKNLDSRQTSIRHKLLMERDPDYRKLYNKQEEEE
jgi:hypothetical protein